MANKKVSDMRILLACDVDTDGKGNPLCLATTALPGNAPVEWFNSCFRLIHHKALRLDWIEAFLLLSNIRSHFWRIEQTLFALCSSRYGVELLPERYDLHLEEGIAGQFGITWGW